MPTASQPTLAAHRPRRARLGLAAGRLLIGLVSFAVNGAVCFVAPGAPHAASSPAVVELGEDRAADLPRPHQAAVLERLRVLHDRGRQAQGPRALERVEHPVE